ncbi:MAG: RNA polymerase sigma factor [Persicimonas sp.]
MSRDHELMEAVADGDLRAFGELVRRHEQTAWRCAYRMLGDEAEAEDAAQEVFLKVLEAADRYQPTASFRTYLYRIIKNHCLDRLAKNAPVYTEDVPTIPTRATSPGQLLERRQTQEEVEEALEQLPGRQRLAVVLFHFEGLSYSEIADAMETTPKAVERLLARGRKALERDLGALVEQ